VNFWGILRRRLSIERVTSHYPATDELPPPAFRGMPELRPSACQGGADCAAVCPTAALRVHHAGKDWTWQLDLASCIACGLCMEACPEDAITMLPTYELASRTRADLVTTLVFRDPADRSMAVNS
jgi:formate hydrogenlyase subunit 6/NADH:ubiquinone oxidoreductase subunit I